MRWRVYLLLTWGCFLAAPSPLARAQASGSFQDQYLKVYLKINDADELERKGDYRGALADFKDCYTRLQKIHNADPNWESALVIHRMNDCRAKIIDLSNKAMDQPVVTPPSPAQEPNPEQPGPSSTFPAASSDDITALKQRLTEVEQELQDTKAKLQNSVIEASTLRTQLDTVNQQLAALKSAQSEDSEMGKLLSQNKALTDKLTAAQKEIASIKSPTGKSGLALVRVQLKNTQDKLDASEAANAALQQTTNTLRQQLDDAQSDLVAANKKLAAAPPSSPEYETLKRENEVMRDILQRELQEQAHRDMAKRLAQEEFDRMKITSKVLQEQLDILGSPMTPPTNDQERALLDSLRNPPAQVTPVPSSGNEFSASNTDTNATPNPTAPATTNLADNPTPPPSTPDTGTSTATNNPSPSTSAAPDQTTNPTPPTTTPGMPDTTTNPPPSSLTTANSMVPSTNAVIPETVTPATPPATPAPDTNTASTPTPPTPSPSTPDNSTNAANTNSNTVIIVPTPETPPATNAPPAAPEVAANTNAISTPAPPTTNAPSADTNTDLTKPPAAATTTYQDTVIKNNDTNAAPASDATEYSSKPRLPDDMRDTAQQAADYFKNGRYDDAAATYQTIIDKYPESLYAWSNLGVVRFQQKKLPEALKALQQAVKLSPTDAFSYSNLGIVYYELGQFENAISALERALALDPSNAKSHNYLGCACSQKGWTEVAEKEFLKAIEIDDTFADAHFNLALVYATEKPPSLEMARRHYKRALELGVARDPRLEKLLQMDGSAQ